MTRLPEISVCICTYQRPAALERLLDALCKITGDGAFTFSGVVADNDARESARPVASRFASRMPLVYVVEPERNIARARNATVRASRGEFIAMIDDDEVPGEEWLHRLFAACTRQGVAGVLGPVVPRFDTPPPEWITRGRFFVRPSHESGFVMPWRECRTGNVLFRRSILAGVEQPFQTEFANGGEDQDFFRRMIGAGHTFIWCREGIVHEVVPPHRWTRGFMIRRALLRGNQSLKHRQGRALTIVKSLLAVPLYGLALPFLLFAGQAVFMKVLVKFSDHAGQLLAVIHLNPVRERNM